MRANGPYEVRPGQLRALVLLLALLPLLPLTFVVRFVIEDVAYERLEAHERARPVYQRLLEAASDGLTASAARQLTLDAPLKVADPWQLVRERPGTVDTALVASSEGRLAPPPPDDASRPPATSPATAALALARTLVDRGVHYAAQPRSGPVRWRFLAETPEPIFSLYPRETDAPHVNAEPSLLLVKTRQHLVEQIATYYQRDLDPQTSLRVVDESGDSLPLVGPQVPAGTRGEPLGETVLRPPLPAWRVQLFSADALVTGSAREQISFY